MTALINEIVVYLIKFICMIACAGLGIFVGGKIRKNKNAKLAAQNTQE